LDVKGTIYKNHTTPGAYARWRENFRGAIKASRKNMVRNYADSAADKRQKLGGELGGGSVRREEEEPNWGSDEYFATHKMSQKK